MNDDTTTNQDAVSKAAIALGRRAAGVPKAFTPEEIEKRTARIQAVNAKRKVAVAKGTLVRTAVSSGIIRRKDK